MIFSLPAVDVDREPIFGGGFAPLRHGEVEKNFEFSKLNHKGQGWLNANYFPIADTNNKQNARHLVKFLLSSIKFKGIKIPLQSRIKTCEIIYSNFSIQEIRLSCEYPSAYDSDGNVQYDEWKTVPAPQSYLNEDYKFQKPLPPSAEYYFFYHSFYQYFAYLKEGKQRVYYNWNVPEEAPENDCKGKLFWLLPNRPYTLSEI